MAVMFQYQFQSFLWNRLRISERAWCSLPGADTFGKTGNYDCFRTAADRFLNLIVGNPQAEELWQRCGLMGPVFQVEFLIFCGFRFRQTSHFKHILLIQSSRIQKGQVWTLTPAGNLCLCPSLPLHVCNTTGSFLSWWIEGLWRVNTWRYSSAFVQVYK